MIIAEIRRPVTLGSSLPRVDGQEIGATVEIAERWGRWHLIQAKGASNGEPVMDKYPEMEVEVIVTDKELDLSTREADVAIWMRQPTQLSYIQKKLIDINYHIYGSPKYLEENGYPNTVKDLDKHKFIVYGKGTPSPLSQTDWILKVGKKDSTKRKSVMRVNNIYSLLLAVESGVGLAALPYYMVQEKSTLVKVLPNIEGPKYEAHFVYPQSLKNVARIKSFRDFIFDKVNEWRF